MSSDDVGRKAAGIGPHAGAAPASPAGSPVPGSAIDDDDRLDGLLPLPVSPLARRRAGRPQGARNRRTDLVAAYLVERFGDPLQASMATSAMPLRDLIVELRKVASDCGLKLGATVMEIARFQRDCRTDVLPYIHAKRAPETAQGEAVTPVIGIGRIDLQQTTVVQAGEPDLEARLAARRAKVVEHQEVSDADGEQSHGAMSHGAPSD